MAGAPLKRLSPGGGLCAGLNRFKEPCGCRQVYRVKNGKLRCRYHGGWHYEQLALGKPGNVGPKSKEALARTLKAMFAGQRRYEARKRLEKRLKMAFMGKPLDPEDTELLQQMQELQS